MCGWGGKGNETGALGKQLETRHEAVTFAVHKRVAFGGVLCWLPLTAASTLQGAGGGWCKRDCCRRRWCRRGKGGGGGGGLAQGAAAHRGCCRRRPGPGSHHRRCSSRPGHPAARTHGATRSNVSAVCVVHRQPLQHTALHRYETPRCTTNGDCPYARTATWYRTAPRTHPPSQQPGRPQRQHASSRVLRNCHAQTQDWLGPGTQPGGLTIQMVFHQGRKPLSMPLDTPVL